MPITGVVRRLPVLLAVLAAVAVPAPAQAAQELFVQRAASATTEVQSATRATLTLRDVPRTVLAFDDRPARRSWQMPLATYLAAWRGSFKTDPPNAALLGRDASGARREVVVELLSARKVAGGVRYGVRTRQGRPPAKLRAVSLFVDPIASLDAVRFPTVIPVTAREDVTVNRGAQFLVGAGTFAFGTVTLQAGSSFVVTGPAVMTVPTASVAAITAAASRAPTTSSPVPGTDGTPLTVLGFFGGPPGTPQVTFSPAQTVVISPLSLTVAG